MNGEAMKNVEAGVGIRRNFDLIEYQNKSHAMVRQYSYYYDFTHTREIWVSVSKKGNTGSWMPLPPFKIPYTGSVGILDIHDAVKRAVTEEN